MANVFGRLKSTSLETVDAYTTETSSITELSYTATEVPQNQTRDITKIIKKKIPSVTGVVEHVLPFDSTLFTDPLVYVAEAVLSPTIGTSLTKAIGVQWGFSKTRPISSGCIFVLGDTQQLETETLLNPQKSTFTVISIVPSAAVAETTFSVTVYKYVPGYTAQRTFTWSSLDTPEVVCAKWKSVMEPYVTFGGTSSSFGHAILNYDRETGKYFGSFDPDTAWGGNLFTLYYEIYRYTGSDDASKVNLGLFTSPTLNLFWNYSMLKRYFPLVAKVAYSRLGVVVDSKQRICVEVLATGSQGLNRRPMKFDITRFIDEFNSNLSFFNPAIAYTMIFSNSDIVFDILFFAGSTPVTVDPEASSNIAFYSQIYKPVFRICGGVLVNSIYTGAICPITRISVITNKTRALGLDDFIEKRLPTTIGHNSFFSGDVIARSNNGETYNIVDNLELLNSELLNSEAVTILTCTAASDSWIVLATPAYNPSVIGALNKVSPAFTGQTGIATEPNWPNSSGWRASQSSIYQNNDSTYWASAETSYSASGVGNQWVQMEFPSAVKVVSHSINPVNTLNTGVPLQWTLSGSNNNSTFANKKETFVTTNSHVAYKYWRITITLIRTAGAAIHAVLYELAFNTAQPIDLTSFKLVLGNAYETPVDWQFNFMLLKNSKVVNSVDSPTFTNNVNIITVPKSWRNADGWRLVTSSSFQNNPLYAANAAMDKRVDTWWGSSENTYTSAGVGSQHITIEYPYAVKMSSFRFAGSTRYPGTTAPTQWTLQASNDTNFTILESYSKTNWASNVSANGTDATYLTIPDLTFTSINPLDLHLMSARFVTSSSFEIITGDGTGQPHNMLSSSLSAWDFTIMLIKKNGQTEDNFKRNAIDLARASYLPLDQAAAFGDSLGFTLDSQLSQADTLVYTDKRTGQPTIVHRGSTTPRDFLVDDALIAFGSGRETQRQRRAREITAATEAKYNKPSNSTGHSLGGRLAERSGSRGSIVTFNKAAGLGDIPNFNFTGRNQPQIQNGSRQTDVRTRLDPISALSSFGRRPSGQAPLVVVRQTDQANRFLPGPVRFFVNAVKAHSLKNLKQGKGR
ncbi:hypothetical protein T492DRAFT_841835 [Pavlovales sp. CCMP2436]|nr:hypothetical protein T492DRAFT_841835 [Pavlovales sp. CCMP2436]